jgi:hypothetical protein
MRHWFSYTHSRPEIALEVLDYMLLVLLVFSRSSLIGLNWSRNHSLLKQNHSGNLRWTTLWFCDFTNLSSRFQITELKHILQKSWTIALILLFICIFRVAVGRFSLNMIHTLWRNTAQCSRFFYIAWSRLRTRLSCLVRPLENTIWLSIVLHVNESKRTCF